MAQAAVYIRVSTAKQALHGESLEAQTEKLRGYCAVRDLPVVAELVESAVTAKKPLSARPQGRKLLALIKAKEVDTVVVWSLDRAFRRTAECLDTVEAWTKRGVALHLFNFGGQAVDTSSAVGRLFLTMLAGFGEFERNVIGERTSLGMAHKASKGEYCGGEPRYGFRAEGEVIVTVAAEQAVIVRAKELRKGGLGSRRVAAKLAEEGHFARSGKPFYPVQVERMCAPLGVK